MARHTKQAAHMRSKGWLLASEAAELIGYHSTSIYKLIRKETLKSTKVGGTIYIELESLREFLGDSAESFLGDLKTPPPVEAEDEAAEG